MSDVDQTVGPPGPNQLHELKNRLTVVKGIVQLLSRQVRRDDWQREKIVARVDSLQDEVARLESLVAGYDSDERNGDDPRISHRPDVTH